MQKDQLMIARRNFSQEPFNAEGIAAQCPKCGRFLHCSCQTCLREERFNSPEHAYYEWIDDTPIVRCTGCSHEMCVDEIEKQEMDLYLYGPLMDQDVLT